MDATLHEGDLVSTGDKWHPVAKLVKRIKDYWLVEFRQGEFGYYFEQVLTFISGGYRSGIYYTVTDESSPLYKRTGELSTETKACVMLNFDDYRRKVFYKEQVAKVDAYCVTASLIGNCKEG